MKDVIAVVLAAGKGTRMKSGIPKVLHRILGKSIIVHILDSIKKSGVNKTIVVTGHGRGLLKEALKKAAVKVVTQKELLGSGHALISAKKALQGRSNNVLVVCGDTPLLKSGTLKELIDKHKQSGASATILAGKLKDPSGYGRIARDGRGRIIKIVEEENVKFYEGSKNEINVGTYCFKALDIFEALGKVKRDNKKKEYYLTDAIDILNREGKLIESVEAEDPDEAIGINERADLAEATQVLKKRILEEVMAGGVTVEDPQTTTIYTGVKIGRDTVIHPNTIIESEVEIGEDSSIGPHARLRPDVRIGNRVVIGDFVELVRTRVGDDSRIKHLTYLGDTTVGRHVNIGAGTITANYDGKNKNKTIIEDGASIGVGAMLIAPVRIGKGAVVGAGCVVPKNHNVPKGATVAGVPARALKKEGAA
ncbi:MAG: hypothetical protein A2987_06940 [Omnitrophica bacterium RIFCSPLOWO2_01_FULL_45_10]|nr:MAG: hypothetical protein A2987_06940 [Omnitrophica bacterium RIFCSPLOWO2_01_FULL_45_10]